MDIDGNGWTEYDDEICPTTNAQMVETHPAAYMTQKVGGRVSKSQSIHKNGVFCRQNRGVGVVMVQGSSPFRWAVSSKGRDKVEKNRY